MNKTLWAVVVVAVLAVGAYATRNGGSGPEASVPPVFAPA